MQIASNIKYIRDLHDLTQDAFAEKIGVTVAALGSYERGFRNPKDAVCKNIANIVGVSLDELKYQDLKTYTLTYTNSEGMTIKLTPALSRDQQTELEQLRNEVASLKALIEQQAEVIKLQKELLANRNGKR